LDWPVCRGSQLVESKRVSNASFVYAIDL